MKNKFKETKLLLNKGFTLIELVIVIAIIGILGTVVISVIDPQASTDRARDTLRIENIRKIVDAVEAYNSLEGGYPTTVPDDLEDSNYISSWPDDEPLPGDRYNYTYSTVGGDPSFVVTTEASNGDEFRYSSIDSGGDPGGRILRCSGGTCNPL